MSDVTPRLDVLGHELETAVRRRIARRRLRRRVTVAATALATVFSAVALASDGVGLETFGLDPGRFELLGSGAPEPDAEFLYATNKETGSTDVFVHTRDAGMDRYAAFQLHQRTARAAAAAAGTPAAESGPIARPRS